MVFIVVPLTLPAQFQYDGFQIADLTSLTLVKNATIEGNRLRLTNSANYQIGACWYNIQQQIGDGFETVFTFKIADLNAGGADGFAFVIQNHALDAIGVEGGGVGYAGIPRSLAIEFDTWWNSGEPDDNHISVQTAGILENQAAHDNSLGHVSPLINLSDGDTHIVKIVYAPPTLHIYLDSLTFPLLSVKVDIVDTLQLTDGMAWVGFTAATGAANQKHYIFSWEFYPLPYLTTQNSNRPESVDRFLLHPNFPNPFNSSTMIAFQVPEYTFVSLQIYDLKGQKIRTLVYQQFPPGRYRVSWNGRDDAGKAVASGIYIVRMAAGKYRKSIRLILLR